MPPVIALPTRNGFTLIELLIATTILLVVVGGGLVSYIRFNDRQVLQTAGKEVITYLRSAQTKARVGDRPAGCNQLLGYAFRGATGSNRFRLMAVCDNGDVLTENRDMNAAVTWVSNPDIRFGVLHGGVTNAGTLTLTNGDLQYQVVVSAGGDISNGEFVDQ
jgi:prepilin-type N-terminal cleavage/methylation domain-containing protein